MTTKAKKRPTKKRPAKPTSMALVKAAPADLAPTGSPMDHALLRMASDPKVDVEKLERLIAMRERVLAQEARALFFEAFSAMQAEIPAVDRRGRIVVDGTLRWRYAKNEDIQTTLKPILQRHGFKLNFRTDFPSGERPTVRVVATLSHRAGHEETAEFVGVPDDSGKKNAIQAQGSTISYGMRYTTQALLNVVSRGQDDDGKAAGPPRKTPGAGSPPARPAPQAPPPPVRDGHEHEPITEADRKRFWALVKRSGRAIADVQAWLQDAHGITDTAKIRRDQYDALCAAVEAPAPLGWGTQAREREPGDDDG